MSDGVKEWDENPPTSTLPQVGNAVGNLQAQPSAPELEAPDDGPSVQPAPVPDLFFGSVDEFVREKLPFTYARRIGPQGPNRWSATWWKHPEAISRLDALWRAWEALRLEPTFGMNVWWRDHADHHMRMLMSPDGPFAASRDQNSEGEPLPYAAPPSGMFIDVRTLPS